MFDDIGKLLEFDRTCWHSMLADWQQNLQNLTA